MAVIGNPKSGEQILIGSSNDYLFLAEANSGQVTIVPVANIASFTVEKRGVLKSAREAFEP